MRKIKLNESELKGLVCETVRRVLSEAGEPYDFQRDYFFHGKGKSPNYDINSDEWQGNFDKHDREKMQNADRINMARLNVQNSQSNGEKVTPEMLSAAQYDIDKPKRQSKKKPGKSQETLNWRMKSTAERVDDDVIEANKRLRSGESPEEIAEEIFGKRGYKPIDRDKAMDYYARDFSSIWETPLDDENVQALYAIELGGMAFLVMYGFYGAAPRFFWESVG